MLEAKLLSFQQGLVFFEALLFENGVVALPFPGAGTRFFLLEKFQEYLANAGIHTIIPKGTCKVPRQWLIDASDAYEVYDFGVTEQVRELL